MRTRTNPRPLIEVKSTPAKALLEVGVGPEPVASVEQAEANPIPSHWLRGFPQTTAESPATSQRHQRQLNWYKRHRRRTRPASLSDQQRAFLLEVGAFLELPKPTVDALLPIYISLLDDLLPIVDGARVFRDYSNGQSSSYLVRALCLVISKAKQAAPFLRLQQDGPVLSPLEFASKLLTGLDAAIKADLELDRVTKIQILALMHLHNDGVAGMDRSSNHLSQAISEAWALSLHWKIPGNADQEECDYLWWTLRNLDRLNKPIQGAAPFIIDDKDVSIERIVPTASNHRSQVMGVSFLLGDLMFIATKVYKATSTATSDDDFDMIPSIEDIVHDASFARFHRAHRSYLEIWYHIAAMLSCRYSGPGTPHYNRRLASADRILAIVSQEGDDDLPPLPLIPYAVSMSTTMVYRAFRDGQRDSKAAYEDLRSCCLALDSLSQRWTSAKGIARLAKRLLKVLSRSSVMNGHKANNGEHLQRGMHPVVVPYTPESDGRRPAAVAPSPNNNRVSGVARSDTAAQEDQPDSAGVNPPFNPVEHWQAIDASYSQLDRAFGELFDYGMPNVFRDPTTLDFLTAAEEASSTGSDFQIPAYFSPDLDFGYTTGNGPRPIDHG